jgi:hypothetical protein
MSVWFVIAVVLVILGNVIEIVRCAKGNSWPEPTFCVVDGAAILFVLGRLAL